MAKHQFTNQWAPWRRVTVPQGIVCLLDQTTKENLKKKTSKTHSLTIAGIFILNIQKIFN